MRQTTVLGCCWLAVPEERLSEPHESNSVRLLLPQAARTAAGSSAVTHRRAGRLELRSYMSGFMGAGGGGWGRGLSRCGGRLKAPQAPPQGLWAETPAADLCHLTHLTKVSCGSVLFF